MITHRMTNTPTYRSWGAMKYRCDNPNATDYKYYGGRGISYPKKWSKFENFYKDMGARPIGSTLDRIDNNKNYSKKNCEWSTHKKQCNNRRTTNKFTYKKETLSIKELAYKYNIIYSCLHYRLMIAKWDINKAIETKSMKLTNNKRKE